MKIIIPMAGKGSRLRPHTLTVPKPLVSVAGKSIVQRLVEDIAKAYEGTITEVAFIIGAFGEEIERDLIAIANSIGAKGSLYYQDVPLGIAHAILCAKETLSGPCMVAFADTLFKASFEFDANADGTIWVQQIPDPSSFGVVTLDKDNYISRFVEKSPIFISDLAIVGIYYFRDGENLRKELQYLIDNDIKYKGEYQLTSGLENMREHGVKFRIAHINEWLDCGNKDAVVYSNQRILELNKAENLVAGAVRLENSVIIPPCYIGANCYLKNSVVGPYVSIGNNSSIEHCVISNSVIQNDTIILDANLQNSMIGNFVEYQGRKSEISIGDYSKYSS
jgi:glucose-1-phosphate thymidylyltransferase